MKMMLNGGQRGMGALSSDMWQSTSSTSRRRMFSPYYTDRLPLT